MTRTPPAAPTSQSAQRPADPVTQTSRALRETMTAADEAKQELARRLGVGVSDAAALDHLMTSHIGLGTVDLAQRLGIRSASATVLVDRLEAAGHVRRAAHPNRPTTRHHRTHRTCRRGCPRSTATAAREHRGRGRPTQ